MESFDAEEDLLAIPFGFAGGSLGFVLARFRLSAPRCQRAEGRVWAFWHHWQAARRSSP